MRSSLLSPVRRQLVRVVEDIDSGNSELSDNEAVEVADFLKKFNYRDKWISKYQAYTYLNMSRAQFDNLVREGRLPRGIKIEGFKELRWNLKDIKEYGKKTANQG